ncbi:hypothetical protein ACFSJY_05105 [Thalassotalea euphylliae]|uniref:hypothetical protein n=1 Tax=Thalassotalea euphylliae TaxID=1655234 RepID=UPI003644E645
MEIYTLNNGRADTLLYALSQNQLKELDSAFKHFNKATGIRIDLYGDTRFSSGNEVLIESIEESLEIKSKTRKDVVNVLKANKKIIFVGD